MALLTGRRPAIGVAEDRETTDPAPRKATLRWRWRLLAVAVALGILLWFLPAIVASTPLLGWVVDRATVDLRGTVRVGNASLGWFSPVSAQDVEVRDPAGNPILVAHRLTTDRSLADLLADWTNLGQLQVEQPKLTLVLRDDGSNVEDLLADYLVPSDDSTPVGFALKITDGSVILSDEGNGRIWNIDDLALSIDSPAGPGERFSLATEATIADAQRPGKIAVQWTTPGEEPDEKPDKETNQPVNETSGELTVAAEGVPLAMFRSLLKRFVPEAQLAGLLSGQVEAQFGGVESHDSIVLSAQLAGEDLVLHAPWFESDRLQLAQLDAACHLAMQDDRLAIEPSSLVCDLGEISLDGRFDLAGRSDVPLPTWLARQTCQVEGRVDLARLAQALPTTLRIRPGTQITSGQVQWSVKGDLDSRRSESPELSNSPLNKSGSWFSGATAGLPSSASRVSQENTAGQASTGTLINNLWRAQIEVDQLEAMHEGRRLVWEKPIQLELVAHDSPEGPVVETLLCESDFLQIDAAGTAEKLAASAEFDLDRLAGQLGQFVDLDGLGFAGKGWAHLDLDRAEGGPFRADAELQVRDFQLLVPDRPAWSEPQLLLLASARGDSDEHGVARLQSAALELSTPTDRLAATLARPVSNPWNNPTWPLHLTAGGQLQNWPARLRTWIALDDWQPAGQFQLKAQASASATAVSVAEATLSIDQFRLAGPSVNLVEPSVRAVFSGAWDGAKGRVRLEPATLSSQSLSLQAGHMLLDMPEETPWRFSAVGRVQGDLARLQQWFDDPHAPSSTRLAGRLSGNLDLSQPEGTTRAELDAEVADLTVTFASGEQYREPRVRLAALGDYEPSSRLLRLESLDLATGALAVRAAGRVASGDETTDAELAGQIEYDLENLSTLAQPYIGTGVRLIGHDTSPISLGGPLDAAKARGNAALRWQRADAHGFQIGPGELNLTLAEGIVRAEPLDLAVNGGRLTLAPQIRLAPGPAELNLPPGPLVGNVQITPAMCASALKYIAPVLADVSMAQGTFSIALDGCRVPLDDPAQGELAGRLTIHSVEVGPGPLVQEMAILLGRAAPATLRRESVVQFRMVDGRVYHQGLELAFPELTLRTYGSVGLDQTMAIMAEMPVPPKWLGNNVLGTALRNQTIRLPIAGTLSEPKIDRREMERLQAQFLQNAAQNVLEDELNRQLDRLFNPQR